MGTALATLKPTVYCLPGLCSSYWSQFPMSLSTMEQLGAATAQVVQHVEALVQRLFRCRREVKRPA